MAEEEGGPQQQRHPGLPAKEVAKPREPREPTLGLFDDDGDAGADPKAMDKARRGGRSTIRRAYAANAGSDGDRHRASQELLPGF
jgi:type IV secretion system protein VirD4